VVTFGNRFFTPSTLGLIFMIFYGAELLGAWAMARIVGNTERSAKDRATNGYRQFFLSVSGAAG
jgi:hypothetical protein